MIHMDAWVLEFLKENIVTLGLIYAVLKAFATITSFDGDDRILESISGAIRTIRGKP